MKKKLKWIILIVLLIIAAIIIFAILRSKKASRDANDNTEEASEIGELYEVNTYATIGGDTAYPLTPVDTEEGTVSFSIANGNRVGWMVEVSNGIIYSSAVTDSDIIITVAKKSQSLESEMVEKEAVSTVSIYSTVVGVRYDLEVAVNEEERLCYSSGSYSLIEQDVLGVVDSKYQTTASMLKLPMGALFFDSYEKTSANDKNGNPVTFLAVYYSVDNKADFVQVAKDITDSDFCKSLENTELIKSDYKKSNGTVAGINVTYYSLEEAIFAIWMDEGLTYYYLSETELTQDAISEKVNGFITGEKIK